MKFKPKEPQEFRPAAFIVWATSRTLTVQEFDNAPVTFTGESGVVQGLFSYGEYAIYSLIPLAVLCRCYPHLWALYAFNKNPTRAEIGNVRVYGLTGYGTDPQQLKPFFEALTAAGVEYGSRSSML